MSDNPAEEFAERVAERVEKEWEQYEGPQGGQGWRNTETGEIRYQDEKPGSESEDGEGEGQEQQGGQVTEDGKRLAEVSDLSEVEEGDTVRVSGDEYEVEEKVSGPGGNEFLRVTHDGEEFTLSEELVDEKVLGEALETGDYDVEPGTFAEEAAHGLVSGEMNKRGADGFLNVRELQHNLSSIENEELLGDMLHHELNNRSSKTAVGAIKSRIRAVGGDPSDHINEGPYPDELATIEEVDRLQEGAGVVVEPESFHGITEPWEAEVTSVGKYSVSVSPPEGREDDLVVDTRHGVEDLMSWQPGERPEEFYPSEGYDNAVEHYRGETLASNKFTRIKGASLEHREEIGMVLEHAETEALEEAVLEDVAETFADNIESAAPDYADTLRENPEEALKSPGRMATNLAHADMDTRIFAAALAGRSDSDITYEHAVAMKQLGSGFTVEDQKEALDQISETMDELEFAKTLGRLRSIESKDLDGTFNGWYHPSRNKIELDSSVDGIENTIAHEFAHAWHYATGVRDLEDADNDRTDSPDDWDGEIGVEAMSSNEYTEQIADDLSEQWDQYKDRYSEYGMDAEVRLYQHTNPNEFIAVAFGEYFDDRESLNEVQPEMVDFFDRHVGGGVETEEVEQLVGNEEGVAGLPEVDVSEGDHVNVQFEDGEELVNAEITKIDGSIFPGAGPSDIEYRLQHGPKDRTVTADEIASMEVRQ